MKANPGTLEILINLLRQQWDFDNLQLHKKIFKNNDKECMIYTYKDFQTLKSLSWRALHETKTRHIF